MYRSSPGLDGSEGAAANLPETKVYDDCCRYFFRSALHLLLPAAVGRSVLLVIRSPFNLDTCKALGNQGYFKISACVF